MEFKGKNIMDVCKVELKHEKVSNSLLSSGEMLEQ